MSTVTLLIRLTMESGWSIGSGGGRQGSLDRTVERDPDGLPFVPATTLRGIWRDAAEQVAFALDGDADGDGDGGGGHSSWGALVDHLFGSQPALDARGRAGAMPIPARLDVTDLRFPRRLRDKVADCADSKRQALRDAFTLVKPGVAIGFRSGRARTDFLRFEEVARQGAVLVGSATVALSGDDAADQALLGLAFASSRLVERIGGDRRRGCGRCTMAVVHANAVAQAPADGDAAIEWLRSATAPALPAARRLEALAIAYGPSTTETTDADDFLVVPLDVIVRTPTVVAQAVLGNVVTSLDHIPGTMLLAGVTEMLKNARLELATIRAGLACGDIRVLPAYPEVGERRGLPVPLVFEQKKDDTRASDKQIMLRNRLLHPPPCGDNDQYKAVRKGYLAFGAKGPAFRVLHLATRTHNTVEDARQKPTEDVGGVYTYEAIPAGERLRSEVWIRKRLAHGLGSPGKVSVSIGRARKAGYGAVDLVPGPRRDFLPSAVPEKDFTLYLASDLLLPGSPVGDGSPEAFLLAEVRRVVGNGVKVVGGDVRTARTEGWVARWNLPRPSYVLVRAGSTLRFEVTGVADLTKLVRLEREGLGLRRGEGFGHVRIDECLVRSDLTAQVQKERPVAVDTTPAAEAEGDLTDFEAKIKAFERAVETAALEARIVLRAELAAQKRDDKLGWSDDKPNTSQLGGLRSVMAGLNDDAQLAQVRAFVTAIEKTDRAEKWGKADAGDRHPLAILEDLFGSPDKIWELIEMRDRDKKTNSKAECDWSDLLVTRPPEDAKADTALQRFAIANFLHAAMRAHKRSMENDQKGAA